jgi:hypothetical protein
MGLAEKSQAHGQLRCKEELNEIKADYLMSSLAGLLLGLLSRLDN